MGIDIGLISRDGREFNIRIGHDEFYTRVLETDEDVEAFSYRRDEPEEVGARLIRGLPLVFLIVRLWLSGFLQRAELVDPPNNSQGSLTNSLDWWVEQIVLADFSD